MWLQSSSAILAPAFKEKTTMSQIRKKEALDYHEQGRKGKLEIVPTKPHSSQRDLALAYSPGVAEPVLAIAENIGYLKIKKVKWQAVSSLVTLCFIQITIAYL